MDQLQRVPETICLTKVVLAAGTTTTLSTTNAATYGIKGKAYVQGSAWTNQATPTTDYATGLAFVPIPIPAGYGCVFTIGLDHSGNMKVIQGQIQALDSNGNFIVAPQFGGLGPQGSGSTDSDFCPIAYMIVKLGSSAVATWTFGTNNNSSVTGVTYSFQDLIGQPDRPQVS